MASLLSAKAARLRPPCKASSRSFKSVARWCTRSTFCLNSPMTTSISQNHSWHVQCATSLSSDTSPSLLVICNDARYLFSAGENFTRACVQDRVSLKKLKNVFLSSAIDIRSTSGLDCEDIFRYLFLFLFFFGGRNPMLKDFQLKAMPFYDLSVITIARNSPFTQFRRERKFRSKYIWTRRYFSPRC